jgi:hypothetical protein
MNQGSPIWVKFIDEWSGVAKQLPTLSKITEECSNDILLLHVSVMWPGASLQTHSGPSYGLNVPEGDTGLKIGGKI